VSTKWRSPRKAATISQLFRLISPNSLRKPSQTSIRVIIGTFWTVRWGKPTTLFRLNPLNRRTAMRQQPPPCLPLDDDNLAINAVIEQHDDVENYPDDIPFVNEHFLSQQYNLLPQVDT
ncbi:hypothetical protein GE21DRAFT_1203999, partial [Neurospora crassa]